MSKVFCGLIVLIFLFIPTLAICSEQEASLVLEQYAKEDREKILEIGLNIYSINIFSKATKAIETINMLGREKVLVDKTFDKNGDSYNIIVPGSLNIEKISSNPYGGNDSYNIQHRKDIGKGLWYSYFMSNVSFNPLRPASRLRGRGKR
jgi:hypothetical protein